MNTQQIDEALAKLRDQCIVQANNPVSSGGVRGLTDAMKHCAKELDAIRTTLRAESVPAGDMVAESVKVAVNELRSAVLRMDGASRQRASLALDVLEYTAPQPPAAQQSGGRGVYCFEVIWKDGETTYQKPPFTLTGSASVTPLYTAKPSPDTAALVVTLTALRKEMLDMLSTKSMNFYIHERWPEMIDRALATKPDKESSDASE